LRFDIDQNGDVTVVTLTGKLTIGAGDIQLRRLIDDLLTQGRSRIVLDLRGVTTIDSSSIGELVTSYARLVNAGGKVVLAGLPEKLNELLHVTQLITVFHVYGSPEEAIHALQNSPSSPA